LSAMLLLEKKRFPQQQVRTLATFFSIDSIATLMYFKLKSKENIKKWSE
jgi:hypothetical protein